MRAKQARCDGQAVIAGSAIWGVFRERPLRLHPQCLCRVFVVDLRDWTVAAACRHLDGSFVAKFKTLREADELALAIQRDALLGERLNALAES